MKLDKWTCLFRTRFKVEVPPRDPRISKSFQELSHKLAARYMSCSWSLKENSQKPKNLSSYSAAEWPSGSLFFVGKGAQGQVPFPLVLVPMDLSHPKAMVPEKFRDVLWMKVGSLALERDLETPLTILLGCRLLSERDVKRHLNGNHLGGEWVLNHGMSSQPWVIQK